MPFEAQVDLLLLKMTTLEGNSLLSQPFFWASNLEAHDTFISDSGSPQFKNMTPGSTESLF